MKTLLILMFLTASLFAVDIEFTNPNFTKEVVSKMCIDGHVWYYTDYRASLVPKLIYETRSGNGSNALPRTVIYHATCKESK